VLITPGGCSVDSMHAVKPDIGSESRLLPTPPALDAPVKASPSEYRHDVWYEKKLRCGYRPDCDMYIRFDRINERDRRTNRHRMTAVAGKESGRRQPTGTLMADSTKVLCPLFDKIELLIPGDSPIIFPSVDRM